MPGADHVKIFRGKDGLFYWGAYAANNEEVAASEGYERKHDAETMARSLFPRATVLLVPNARVDVPDGED